jgi:hypothetical protein
VQYTQGDCEVMPLVWLFMGCSVVLYRMLQERKPEAGLGLNES